MALNSVLSYLIAVSLPTHALLYRQPINHVTFVYVSESIDNAAFPRIIFILLNGQSMVCKVLEKATLVKVLLMTKQITSLKLKSKQYWNYLSKIRTFSDFLI